MRIGEICQFFVSNLVFQIEKIRWFSNLENSDNFLNLIISKIVRFPLLKNSWNNKISEIVEF